MAGRWIWLLIVVAMMIAAVPARAQEKRIALLIGNQAYDRSVGALKNPHNDIALVGAALTRQGFELLPLVKDARRAAILTAVRDLVRRLNAAGAGAIGFIYYSGHGAAEKDTNINYLIPVDAKEPGSTIFWDESLKLDDILKLLDGARGAAKFIVFDACRNELQLPTKDTSKGLMPVAEQQGMFIAYASAPGKTASDRGARSGPYAAALAAELAKSGLDHLNLFQNVKETVLASTGGAQQPWESNGLGRRVYLTGRPQQVSAPAPPPAAPPPQPPMSEAAQAWTVAKDTTNIGVLEAFVRRFGDSFYGDLARARIDELRKSQLAVVAPPAKPPEPAPKSVTPPPTPASTARPSACDGIDVALGSGGTTCIKPGSGQTFRDCPDCPEMVVVPAGSFMMGSPASEPQRGSDEGPQRRVTLAKPFGVGKFEVTFSEWDACVAASGCKHKREAEWGRGRQPVTRVSWDDAKEYVAWLSRKAGKTYRLLTEAEWEYAARAGTTTPFWWGSSITPSQANYDGSADPYKGGGSKGEYRQRTVVVDSFAANPWGLHNVHGNVWEWTEDCWHDSYHGAPSDGSAWTTSCTDGSLRVLRGGSWNYDPRDLRSADRISVSSDDRGIIFGFRVGRTF
ncbi:MAG: SUMF1/EgtB/PvdO family nonheme iron enzyme [Hyphomicrobiaceae bacterium]